MRVACEPFHFKNFLKIYSFRSGHLAANFGLIRRPALRARVEFKRGRKERL